MASLHLLPRQIRNKSLHTVRQPRWQCCIVGRLDEQDRYIDSLLLKSVDTISTQPPQRRIRVGCLGMPERLLKLVLEILLSVPVPAHSTLLSDPSHLPHLNWKTHESLASHASHTPPRRTPTAPSPPTASYSTSANSHTKAPPCD